LGRVRGRGGWSGRPTVPRTGVGRPEFDVAAFLGGVVQITGVLLSRPLPHFAFFVDVTESLTILRCWKVNIRLNCNTISCAVLPLLYLTGVLVRFKTVASLAITPGSPSDITVVQVGTEWLFEDMAVHTLDRVEIVGVERSLEDSRVLLALGLVPGDKLNNL